VVLAECKWFCKVHSSNLQNKSRHSKVHLHIPGKYLQSVALHSYESLHKPKKIDILVANQRWDRFFLKKIMNHWHELHMLWIKASNPEVTNYKSLYNIVCAVFYKKWLGGEMMSSQQMTLSQNGNSSNLNTKMKKHRWFNNSKRRFNMATKTRTQCKEPIYNEPNSIKGIGEENKLS